MSSHQRAYSLLTVKSVDEDARIITGIATTPETDRMGDIVEPKGAQFKLPIPLLWQHNAAQPIGHVTAAKVTADGIVITAQILKLDEPGVLKDRLDEAWQSIKAGLVRGLSIGFKAIESARIEGTYGYRFLKWLWLELSAVTIPANGDATITALKSIDAPFLAVSGTQDGRPTTPRDRGTVRRLVPSREAAMKTYTEQIKEFEATRAAKVAERDAIQQKALDEGRAKDESERESFQALSQDIEHIDAEIKDLRVLEKSAQEKAVPVDGTTPEAGTQSRGGQRVIRVADTELPKGIAFARYVACKAASAVHLRSGSFVSPLDLAKKRYPSMTGLHAVFEKAVEAGTTFGANWADDLVPYKVLANDFIEFLRGKTIVDRFGQDGIPSLRRVPFNIRVGGFSAGTTGYWKGEGKPTPVSKATTKNVTLAWATVSGLTVITKELATHSTPSAETALRDDLSAAVVARMDIDFVDPAKAASANTSPASITYGLPATGPSGTAAVNVRADLATLLGKFATANLGRSNLVLIMSDTMAGNIAMMVNALGQADFPQMDLSARVPRLAGIPVITSEHLTSLGSPSTQMIVLVKADEVYLADEGMVDVEASFEASVEMLDTALVQDGTSGTGTDMVSLWQAGLIGLLANREVNWTLRRANAVEYISPAAYAPPTS